MFETAFGDRVAGFNYALTPPRTRKRTAFKFIRKVGRTLTLRCDFLPTVDPNLRRLCTRIARPEAFDAIILSSVLLRGLPLPHGVPIVGDTHNVEFDVLERTSKLAESRLRRQYARWQAGSMFREERRCGREVDLLLASSERDRELFEQKLGVRNVAVIANGVDVTEFSPSEVPGEPGTVLFTGLMSYYPNQQAIRWFLHEVFPQILKRVPRAKLIVAGADPPEWLTAKRGGNLEVTGSVPDMRPYFERARVVIAPLMIGGGTRVKILEAQAMQKPVVSTSLGAEGLIVRDGHSILLADDARSFAMQVVRLLDNVDFASRVGANGRSDVALKYDWERIGERLENLLRETIGLVGRDHAKSHTGPIEESN